MELYLDQRFSTLQVKHNASEVEVGSRCSDDTDVRS